MPRKLRINDAFKITASIFVFCVAAHVAIPVGAQEPAPGQALQETSPDQAGNIVDQDEFQNLRPFTPTASAALKRIRRAGVLRVGLQRDYQPFHIVDSREGFPGIDAEVAESLAAAMDVRLQFEYADVGALMRLLQDGRIDAALGGISATVDRARYVYFSDPYIISSPAALLSRRSLPSESESVDFPRTRLRGLGDLGALPSLTLAVRAATTTEQLLRKEAAFRRFTLKSYAARSEALAALLSGEADALIADRVYLQALMLRRPELSGAYLTLFETYREDHLSIALAQGDPEFALYVNFFVKEMQRTGQLNTILRRYLESREWLP